MKRKLDILPIKAYIIAFFLLLILYLLLFIQFPLHNTIGGTCDALLTIASGNFFGNYIQSVFSGYTVTSSLYPSVNVFQWGESAVGLLSLFNFFKLLGCTDVLSWYFYVVTIFTLNSFGVFIIAHHYTKNLFVSILGGVLFAFTNFAFVNLDDAHVLFYFFTAISVVLLLRYKETGRIQLLFLACIFSALQVYFSLYVFVYGTLVFLVFFIYSNKLFFKINGAILIRTAICFLMYLVVVLPFIVFYWHAKTQSQAYLPENGSWNNIIENAVLQFHNFFSVMPNNRVLPSSFQESDALFSFFEYRKSAFFGTLFMSAGIFFMIKYFKKLWPWIMVVLIGFLFSSYPYKILSSNIEFFEFVRLPYRAYFISVFALSVIVAIGLNESFKNTGKKKQILLYILIALIHVAENTPYPFPLSDFDSLKNEIKLLHGVDPPDGFYAYNIAPDECMIQDVQRVTNANSVLLCLPSNRIFGQEHGMLCYNREEIYMNHQAYFNRNMFNGVHGYIPKTRVDVQNHIDNINENDGLSQLITLGLTHIIFYKNMILDHTDDNLDRLKENERLSIIEETNEYIIFECGNFAQAKKIKN